MVKVNFEDAGTHRWKATVHLNKNMAKEFFVWLDDTIPDCHVRFISSTVSYSTGTRSVVEKYEIRGGDPTATTLVALRWSGNENE